MVVALALLGRALHDTMENFGGQLIPNAVPALGPEGTQIYSRQPRVSFLPVIHLSTIDDWRGMAQYSIIDQSPPTPPRIGFNPPSVGEFFQNFCRCCWVLGRWTKCGLSRLKAAVPLANRLPRIISENRQMSNRPPVAKRTENSRIFFLLPAGLSSRITATLAAHMQHFSFAFHRIVVAAGLYSEADSMFGNTRGDLE